MKRLLLPVCVILIAIVLFSGIGNNGEANAPENLSVSEAAFVIRTSDSEDASAFLVGRFQGEQGTRLNFDGAGTAEKTSVNLTMESGTYVLTQASGGTALLQIKFGGELRLYTFSLTSNEGAFRLTDADGNSEIFTPLH